MQQAFIDCALYPTPCALLLLSWSEEVHNGNWPLFVRLAVLTTLHRSLPSQPIPGCQVPQSGH